MAVVLANLRWCTPNFREFVDRQDNDGCTALVLAVMEGNRPAVISLLNERADPKIRDNYRMTALQYAVGYERGDICSALLAAGADPFTLHANGGTSLSVAEQIFPGEDFADGLSTLIPFVIHMTKRSGLGAEIADDCLSGIYNRLVNKAAEVKWKHYNEKDHLNRPFQCFLLATRVVYAIRAAGPNSLLLSFLDGDKAAVVRRLAQGENPRAEIWDSSLEDSTRHMAFAKSSLSVKHFAEAKREWKLPGDEQEEVEQEEGGEDDEDDEEDEESPYYWTHDSEINDMVVYETTLDISLSSWEERLQGVPDEHRDRFFSVFNHLMDVFSSQGFPSDNELGERVLNGMSLYWLED